MAVVTSSVPLGGVVVDSGGGSAVRARSVDSRSAGAPARTGRGLRARAGLARAFRAGFFPRGFPSVFSGRFAGFFRPRFAPRFFAGGFAAFFARGFAAVFVAVPPLSGRSRPNLVGRVAGRLPRTLSSSRLSLIPSQSTFHERASGDWGGKRGRMRIERLDSAPS